MIRLIATSTAALFAAASAHAGGWVAPVVDVAAPPSVAGPQAGPNWWLALIPLAVLFAVRGGGGDRATLPPGDHGGPCFVAGTLIGTDQGWRRVEDLAVGDVVATSKGAQAVLSVESWQPTEYRDRPVIFNGVRLSKNHCVDVGGVRVPAQSAPSFRGMIDGRRFYHVLTRDHAWLDACADPDGPVIRAETMQLTDDIQPLASRFPGLAAHHAAEPCDQAAPSDAVAACA